MVCIHSLSCCAFQRATPRTQVSLSLRPRGETGGAAAAAGSLAGSAVDQGDGSYALEYKALEHEVATGHGSETSVGRRYAGGPAGRAERLASRRGVGSQARRRTAKLGSNRQAGFGRASKKVEGCLDRTWLQPQPDMIAGTAGRVGAIGAGGVGAGAALAAGDRQRARPKGGGRGALRRYRRTAPHLRTRARACVRVRGANWAHSCACM